LFIIGYELKSLYKNKFPTGLREQTCIFLYNQQIKSNMASNFPKLPGYVPTHDPTNVNHKKVSHIKLEEIRNAKNVVVPLHALPR